MSSSSRSSSKVKSPCLIWIRPVNGKQKIKKTVDQMDKNSPIIATTIQKRQSIQNTKSSSERRNNLNHRVILTGEAAERAVNFQNMVNERSRTEDGDDEEGYELR
ncbi:hypothetical protein F2Q70_00035713 [Brassica cretica]|uniref:Uncharacterized protein n=2 Tax=Brassica cretica TaxID=69181 RepID=A0A3N6QBZ4_BRACR|nr:hypothetical protein F2Q68_00030927 [Brassica cretica]KAF2587499.1 hypothetical protein F2Q70_00035713 [Brassica cretica]KAF3533346.1 hypothetical protein DY000_02039730 [Brassica cretica]